MAVDLDILPDLDALADATARRFVSAANEAIRARGRFLVALPGAATPRLTFERLAREPLVSQVGWSHVQVLWGDERCVPPNHRESNYRMACETLLNRIPIPATNVHRIHGEDEPRAAAMSYETMLRSLLRTPIGPPRAAPGVCIDLVIMGLGDDGHTASLFPGSAALSEPMRWVVAAYSSADSMWRVTLTPAVFNAAAEVIFLVAGASKTGVVKRVLEGLHHPDMLPAQAIALSHGRLHWLLDAAAAADLDR